MKTSARPRRPAPGEPPQAIARKVRARPRQLPGGGWIQVIVRGRSTAGTVPAGYCAGHAGRPHATAEAADACWRKYLVERTLKLDCTRAAPGTCIAPGGCETVTNRTVVINGYPRGHWCDEHRTTQVITRWWNAATAAGR